MKKEAPKCAKRILAILDLTYQSGREQLEGIYQFVENHKWELALYTVIGNGAEMRALIQNACRRPIDGAIVKSGTAHALAEEFLPAQCPISVIETPLRGFQTRHRLAVTSTDNVAIARLAAAHFQSLGRFASYAYVPSDIIRLRNMIWCSERQEAFCELHKGKVAVFHPTGGRAKLKSWLKALPKPAALFAANDETAAEVISTCKDAALPVPDQVAILGVDNDSLCCEHTNPRLSSIALNQEGKGYAAAEALRILMDNPKAIPTRTISPKHIVARASTAFSPPAVALVNRALSILALAQPGELSVADISRRLGVSQSLLNLRFREILHHSLRDELISRKLNVAKQLLSGTDIPVSRIAARIGFTSSSAFNHLFSRHFGNPPGDFRKPNRGRDLKKP